jgi:hypothetical protein
MHMPLSPFIKTTCFDAGLSGTLQYLVMQHYGERDQVIVDNHIHRCCSSREKEMRPTPIDTLYGRVTGSNCSPPQVKA